MAVDHQFGEEDKIGFRRGRALTPAVDGGQDALRFAQKPIHTHGRHTGHLHRKILSSSGSRAHFDHKRFRSGSTAANKLLKPIEQATRIETTSQLPGAGRHGFLDGKAGDASLMASGYRLSSITRWMNASPSAFNGTSTTYIAMLDDADWSVPDRAWRSVMRVQYSTGRVQSTAWR